MAQIGEDTTPRSPGSLAASLGGPGVPNRTLAEDARPAHASLDVATPPSGRTSMSDSETERHTDSPSLPAEEPPRPKTEGRMVDSELLRLLPALCGQDKLTLAELERDPQYYDSRLSRSAFHFLVVLTPFALRSEHKVTQLAEELGMSTSTAVRYLKTWVALGVLKQETSRRYCLAVRLPRTSTAVDEPHPVTSIEP